MNTNYFTKEELLNKILQEKLYCDWRGNIYHPDYAHALSTSTGMWQFPDELAELLVFLQDKNIKTFLNIGTYNGITFNLISDILNKFTDTTCISIDSMNHNPIKNNKYIYQDTTSVDFKNKRFDLVFIDGDHSYQSVKNDYLNVGQYAKYCVFHDIDDNFIRNDDSLDGGVPRFWEEVKETNKYIEFNSSKKIIKIMGIGLLYE